MLSYIGGLLKEEPVPGEMDSVEEGKGSIFSTGASFIPYRMSLVKAYPICSFNFLGAMFVASVGAIVD